MRFVHGAVMSVMKKVHEPGLLGAVVGFGRLQLVERVLREPKLRDERQPFKLQQHFHEALLLAVYDTSYDLGVIETLIGHGARVSDVCLTDLFDHCTTPVGFVAHVVEQRQLVITSFHDRARRNVDKKYKGREKRSGFKDAVGGRIALKRIHVEIERLRRVNRHQETVPWADEFADMLEAHIPGFSLYAEDKSKNCTPVTNFDLMIWAICCGGAQSAIGPPC